LNNLKKSDYFFKQLKLTENFGIKMGRKSNVSKLNLQKALKRWGPDLNNNFMNKNSTADLNDDPTEMDVDQVNDLNDCDPSKRSIGTQTESKTFTDVQTQTNFCNNILLKEIDSKFAFQM
jgi:hypothetical protein